jgi:hypothetical protein
LALLASCSKGVDREEVVPHRIEARLVAVVEAEALDERDPLRVVRVQRAGIEDVRDGRLWIAVDADQPSDRVRSRWLGTRRDAEERFTVEELPVART